MAFIYEDATHQTLNHYRKCIYVHFEQYALSMSIYPIPPLAVVEKEDHWRASMESVHDFIAYYDCTIVFQERDADTPTTITGVWIRHKGGGLLADGFIPVQEGTLVLENVPFSESFTGPILVPPSTSYLDQWKTSKLLANVLKEYALYTYARHPDRVKAELFTVVPNHVYAMEGLHGRLIPDTPIMYSDERLIVTSQEVADRLYAYVLTMVKYDLQGVLSYSQRTYMKHTLDNLSDFKVHPNTHLFGTKMSLDRYLQQREDQFALRIQMVLPSKQSEVVYYGSHYVTQYPLPNDKLLGLCMVQFVQSDQWKDAFYVARTWAQDKVNPGYHGHSETPIKLDDIKAWRIYIYREYEKSWKIRSSSNAPGLFLIEYQPRKVAALLPIETAIYE